MLTRIKSFFDQHMVIREGLPEETNRADSVPLAVCALLLEMAQADGEFTDGEMGEIVGLMKKEFGLSREDVEDLMALAEEERRESVDLWQFSKLISDQCDRDEKLSILDTLWSVVYADGILDRHEDYLMHKLAYVLNLSHKELIESKLRITED